MFGSIFCNEKFLSNRINGAMFLFKEIKFETNLPLPFNEIKYKTTDKYIFFHEMKFAFSPFKMFLPS